MKEIPEELMPVVEWWEKNGRQTLIVVAIAAASAAVYFGVQRHREAQRLAASEALVNSQSVEELESALAQHGSSKAGSALKLRLAKKYFDEGRFDAALGLYRELEANPPPGFDEAPALGAAHALEALGRYDEAAKAFEAFAAVHTNAPWLITAQLGAARAYACSSGKDKALAALEDLKTRYAGDELSLGRIEDTIMAVKRWEKRPEGATEAK